MTSSSSLSTRILALLAFILPFAGLKAHSAPSTRVSLLTCSPGKEIYQLEGHAAMRLLREPSAPDADDGFDIVVNWGVFDFNAPNFVYRFVKGDTDYMACAYPTEIFLEEYQQENRTVTEQVLDLTPGQAAHIEALVAHNILPDNRTYRYNYVKDNCATRPLALIEEALGSHVTLASDSSATATEITFRSEMERYHANYPWYQFGIDLALGSGLDYPITNRERAFAPVYLEKELSSATYIAPDGSRRKLVTATDVLNQGAPEGVSLGPTPFLLTPVAAGIYLALLTLLLTIRDIRRRKLTRWFDTALFGTFFLAGCVITFLVFVSSHEASSPNWLIVWLNPLCIIPAAGIWIKRCKRAVYFYQICNFAALTLLLAGHHFFGQTFNAAFPLFILCDLMRSFTQIFVLGNIASGGTTGVSGQGSGTRKKEL